MRFAIGVVVAVVLCALPGCGPSNDPLPHQDGDEALFATMIQPILARHCAYVGCHGREGMPLTTYAVDYLRLRDPDGLVDTTRTKLDETALSKTEIDLNRRSLAARVTREDPTGELFILRLIPVEAGGIPHAGVVVFQSLDDPELLALRRFLETVDAR